MKLLRAAFTGLLSSLLYVTAQAGMPSSSPNTYHSIVERNVFHLTPIPPPPQMVPPVTLPELILTGLTTILGDSRALLKIRYPAGPGQQAREEDCILRLGEREGPIQVLEIDEKAASAVVNNSGTIMTVTFGPPGPEHKAGAPQQSVPHPPFRVAEH